jgi:predicted phosphodiesterase
LIKTAIVLPDIHAEYTDHTTLRGVYRYIKDRQPDYLVQIGDFMDFDIISSHNKGNLRSIEGKTLHKAYREGNLILDQLQTAAPNAAFTILEGNHDYRIERYIDEHPEMKGTIEVPIGLSLAARGINWIPTWSTGEPLVIGNASFIHGLYTNDHHAKKTVQAFGRPVFYGHTHDVQCYSQVLTGDNKTLVGQSLGCLCDYGQTYMMGRPSKWQQAFAEFHFWPNGFFQYFVVMIFQHRFVAPTGDLYDGRKK